MLIPIADAVVSDLNAQSFSIELTAARAYQPVFDLREMSDLHVTVVPAGQESERNSRSTHQRDYMVQIGVQQKVDPDDLAESDQLMQLVDEIGRHFEGRAFQVDGCTVAVVNIKHDPVFLPEHMQRMNQFTSVINLKFRTTR